CYDKIIENDVNYGNTLCQKGRLLSSIGRYNDAIDCFDRILLSNPINTNALYYKSCAMLKDGRKEESFDLLESMISIDSRYKDVLRDEKDLEAFRIDKRFMRLMN
ncbi:MAG: hypothetical protein KGH88_09335, partial [Thaumarchaeota archaeon]|nr:hypothetical protein [Nitrososphaerota archaeon]